MNLQELIKEYKEQAIICSKIDYSDKKSVNANNDAIKRMYEIVNFINSKFDVDGTGEFSRLIDIKDHDVNVWSATHLLEIMNPDRDTKEKALSVIREVARRDDTKGLGFRHWLKDYETRSTN